MNETLRALRKQAATAWGHAAALLSAGDKEAAEAEQARARRLEAEIARILATARRRRRGTAA